MRNIFLELLFAKLIPNHSIIVGGQTICSAFGFKFGNSVESLGDKKKAELRCQLSELKLIIIDEMSLVGADMLYRIHLRLREIFDTPPTVPFGGINVILVGDLLQLPPVMGNYIFSSPEKLQFLGLHNVKPLWQEFKPMILKHNHRQGEDRVWADRLNRFREGICWKEDEEALQDMVIDNPIMEEDAMNVMYYNTAVNSHNDKMLNSLKGNLLEVKATQQLPKGCKSVVDKKKGTIGQTLFRETLKFKIGAKCQLVFNVDLIDGLFNGAGGKIIGVERKGAQIYCIIVKFDNDNFGTALRAQYSHLPFMSKYKGQNGTPIFQYRLEHQLTSAKGWRSAAKANLMQFPLRINYAQTSHKMQVSFIVRPNTVLSLHCFLRFW